MKSTKEIDRFLHQVVNINQTRLDQLDDRTNAIEDYLRNHSVYKELVVQTIPQGSWAHQTIIRPQNNREFDADYLLEVREQTNWTPRDYLSSLRRAFRDSGIYSEMVVRKNRCVRIVYADDCHVDVVPFVRSSNLVTGSIVNWANNTFEQTSPEAFTAWFDECNQAAGGHLRKVCRLLKYLRDIKATFTVKSVILTTLVGTQVERSELDPSAFTDVPTALKTLTRCLADYLCRYPLTPPSVPDPSTPGRNFDHRWPDDLRLYSNFVARIQFYADKIEAAYLETDPIQSLIAWQAVFGDEFDVESRKKESFASLPDRTRDPDEKFIDDPEFGISLLESMPYSVTIRCRVLAKPGFRQGDLDNLGFVATDRSLKFSVRRCNVPDPYQVYWKIKNTGPIAAEAKQLRGDIHLCDTRIEPTKYRGQHWVECYIVKDGRCVARQRYTVRIR